MAAMPDLHSYKLFVERHPDAIHVVCLRCAAKSPGYLHTETLRSQSGFDLQWIYDIVQRHEEEHPAEGE